MEFKHLHLCGFTEQVEIHLEPSTSIDLMEGDDITFECRIKNKPRNSQVSDLKPFQTLCEKGT